MSAEGIEHRRVGGVIMGVKRNIISIINNSNVSQRAAVARRRAEENRNMATAAEAHGGASMACALAAAISGDICFKRYSAYGVTYMWLSMQ
jgi:hypothetical protein